MTGESLDILADNLVQLKALFPQVFTEGKLDLEKFKATFTNKIHIAGERYVLNWAGKADAFRALQVPATGTLLPQPEESVNFDEAENIFIEGENLEVLKLLQKAYYNKIKCIYIDPPYNTGNDSFIYPDSFKESRSEYEKRVGDKDDEGQWMKEGLFRKNSKDSGHFHSNWLSMIYPRLFLARNLLTDDGVIFVHIDDNEVHNLRLLMNEVFGEENFIECITWNKRVPKNDKGIGSIHEYVLIYVKNSGISHEFKMGKEGIEEIEELRQKMKRKAVPLPEAEDEIRKLYKKKGYDRGITLYNSLNKEYRLWGKINLSWPNADTFGPRYKVFHPINKKEVKIPERGWRWKEDTFNDAAGLEEGEYTEIIKLHDGTYVCKRIWFDKDENTQPSSINFLDELEHLLLRSIISLKSDGGIEVERIFEGKSYFSYPKPTSLVKLLLKSIKTRNGDIFMDFFAGSGTTADSIFQLNSEDSINRKFISIQLPELTETTSEAFKAGFKNIASIGIERIKRVIKSFPNSDVLGLKVFCLSDSNFKLWRGKEVNEENLEAQLQLFTHPLADDATPQGVLYELMLKAGIPLTSTVQSMQKGGRWFLIAQGELAIALETATPEMIAAMLEAKPQRVLMLDECFKNNDQLKTNSVLQMKDAGVEFKTI